MPFSEKQQEFFENASHRWNFKVGATRSGKTYMDYYVIPKRIRHVHGLAGWVVILGVSKATIERNVLEPMRQIWGEKYVGRISSNNTCNLFGERAYCLGAEKVSQVSKLRGSSIKYAYGDEVADWSPDVFELLKSRLDKDYSCFDGALNPQSPNHWLKEFLDSDVDIYNQHYTIFDNPFLPKAFVENLCKEYEGTVYYQRYILGEWALAEGLIYPSFNTAIIEDMTAYDGKPTDYSLSIDYGTQNAFAALLWAKYGPVWVCIDEYYYSGRDTGVQKSDTEYADALDGFIKMIIDSRKKQAEKDHTYFRKMKTVIDPSAASFIVELERRKNYSVMKADNAVADGLRETYTCMKLGYIKILRSCRNLIDELNGYVWDEKAGDDSPLKVNDHACDAMRYFVKTYGLATPRKEYISPYGRF